MKLVIFRSRERPGKKKIGEYDLEFDTRYAEKVIGNLLNADDFCTSCADECIHCRRPYKRTCKENVADIFDLPSVLPYLLENPGKYMPCDVPRHDVLLVICIHEQILLEVLKRCKEWGTRAVIVPLEAPNWIRGGTITEARQICEKSGIEIAFPKPFCSLDPPAGTILETFRDRFHTGCPEIEIKIKDGKIEKAFVRTSAPCGATYYVARWLIGRSVKDNLKFEVVSKRWHSYPCTASMEWDDEIGNTILHLAGNFHFKVLDSLSGRAEREKEKTEARVFVPFLGVTLPKPIPPEESMKHVEDAKMLIINKLTKAGVVTLEELKETHGIMPAALTSAILLLKKEGKIRVDERGVWPAEHQP